MACPITSPPARCSASLANSGCGKSVAALSILGLIPTPPGRIVAGSIRFRGRELVGLNEAVMREIRGNEISVIFQEPMTSLNPVMRVGRQIAEPLMLHQGLSKRAAYLRAAEMLDMVRIPDSRRRMDEYPHQLSGGTRQRVMIAMALACRPAVLDRRRTDDGARRHHTGADSAAAAGAAA